MQLYEKLRNRDDVINFGSTYTMVEIQKNDRGKIETEERTLDQGRKKGSVHTARKRKDFSTRTTGHPKVNQQRRTYSEPFTWNGVEFKCHSDAGTGVCLTRDWSVLEN